VIVLSHAKEAAPTKKSHNIYIPYHTVTVTKAQ